MRRRRRRRGRTRRRRGRSAGSNPRRRNFRCTRIEGVCRTAAISACMMAAPAPSPLTCTMRRAEWAASCDGAEPALRGRGRTARHSCSRSSTRARGLAATDRATVSGSTRPAPAAIVSAACGSGLSPSPTAAAMPPCAQADEAPSPSGAAASTATGSGASFSAQNRPARPPPTIRMSAFGHCGFDLMSRLRSLSPRVRGEADGC